MGLTTPCMLENSQAAHLNFACIHVYSIHYWLPGPTTSPFLGPKSPTRRGYTYQAVGRTPGPTYPRGSPHPVCSKIPRLRTGTSHISPYSIYPAHYIAISNPTGVHLLGSGQDTWAYLPMGLTTPCMLENSQAAHLNFAYIPVYSIPITGYRAPLHRHF